MLRWSLAVAVLGLLLLLLSGPALGAAVSERLAPAPPAADGGGATATLAAPTGSVTEAGGHKWAPPIWAVIPFVLMLLSIAIVPLLNEHWWENDRNRGLVSALLGIPVLVYVHLADVHHGQQRILHTAQEYSSFIILLGSLFVISGGIVITGNLRGTPIVNTAFLAVGGLLASFIGTTGAAMLLIRPLLNTNSERHHVLHTVIFFIFLVCNCGGCLTPLGDPPLFLGYLKGIPFTWTFSLVPEWAVVAVALLVIYFVFDTVQYAKEKPADIKLDAAHERPLVVRGAHNFLFLGGVVVSVALTDIFQFPSREGFMVLMSIGAWTTTRADNRSHNSFTFGPIREVAVVFSGIFSTMIPALALLNAKGGELGVDTTTAFFWATGSLSSFLDNAPTYLSFLALGGGVSDWAPVYLQDCIGFAAGHPAVYGTFEECTAKLAAANTGNVQIFVLPQAILRGISLGAVFLGAMTYIGNGPNFMVRAIANEAGIKMPSFFGYILWSCLFLLPLFFLVTKLFF